MNNKRLILLIFAIAASLAAIYFFYVISTACVSSYVGGNFATADCNGPRNYYFPSILGAIAILFWILFIKIKK